MRMEGVPTTATTAMTAGTTAAKPIAASTQLAATGAPPQPQQAEAGIGGRLRRRFFQRSPKPPTTAPGHASVRQGMSFIRHRPSAPVDLPQMLPCAGGCGYFGSPQSMNLCSKCYQGLCQKARLIKDREAITQLLELAGFPSLADFKRDMAFRKQYPDAISGDERDSTPGVAVWQTTLHPLSQFDKIPQRGNSACTYIAGVTALRFALREEIPTPETWADCIVRGVKAYHNAMSEQAVAENHADISEVFPFILPTLGMDAKEGLVDVTTTVVTLHKPDDISGDDFQAVIGPEGYPECSKKGLIDCFMQAFSDSMHSSTDVDDGDTVQEPHVQRSHECALVVTRPPETYCVLKTSDGRVFWRDSHRRKQYDFESTDVFQQWLEADGIFTVPLKGCPLAMNQVAISSVSPTVAAHIADGMAVLV